VNEGFAGQTERRKRLGQYFTGVGLARLLAALAGAERMKSAIDPMAGSGDMLAACVELGAKPEFLSAVDIDPCAQRTCSERIQEARCVLGSAFDTDALSLLPRRQWDLVITNPPYVRYQSMSRGAGKGIRLPSAMEVRNGLLKVLDNIDALDDTDRVLFQKMATGYSGLADFAVPSWILCAALVAPGGSLALVVPESWLSRDYAAVVHYLLLRWFKIEFVVEDEHAAWFSDAQVKTSLIVARRIPRRESAFNRDPCETFLRLRISGRAQGPNGVIDRLYPGKTHKESFFAEQARTWLSSGAGHKDELVEAFHVPVARVAVNLLGVCTKQAWFSGMEDFQSGGAMFTPLVPQELADWLALRTENFPVVSLESLGVSVGQGLRTGANRFFYADALTESDRTVELSFNWYAKDVLAKAPSSCALPVLRRQAELPDGYVVRASNLKGRVLALQGAALTEDIEAGGEVARRAFMSMPDSLASLVRAAAKANFGAQNEPKRIYELTAVAPNIRKANATKGTPPRFWYMLPDFSARHRPDLLIARINNASPKAFINEGREALVDANFSTIWLNGTPHVDAHAMLALLNSSWCRAVLELSASIMGGGALKVEATHLRRLPIPIMAAKDWKALSGLGRKLASTKTEVQNKDVLRRIDYFVASALLRRAASETDTGRLRGLATEGMLRRQNHKQKG
jgi:hypothetical protein